MCLVDATVHSACLGWCRTVLGGASCKQPFLARNCCSSRSAWASRTPREGISVSPPSCLQDWGQGGGWSGDMGLSSSGRTWVLGRRIADYVRGVTVAKCSRSPSFLAFKSSVRLPSKPTTRDLVMPETGAALFSLSHLGVLESWSLLLRGTPSIHGTCPSDSAGPGGAL